MMTKKTLTGTLAAMIACTGMLGMAEEKSVVSDRLASAQPEIPPSPSINEGDFRTWTSTNGTHISATLVNFDGKDAILRKADGKTYTVPTSTLIRCDTDYLQSRRTATSPGPAGAMVPGLPDDPRPDMDANADGGRKDLETREFTLDKALMVYNGGKPLDVFLVRAGVLPADALIRENRATGVLLVTSTPEELRHLQGFLDALPMPPAEVVLDVIVYKTAPGTAKNLNALASSHASVVLGRPFYDWTTNMETIARSLATSAVDEAGRPAARRTRDLTQTYMESETVVFKYRVKCRTDGAWNGGRTGGGERLEVALRLMPESLPPIADGMSTVLLSLDGQIKNYFDKKEAWSHDDLTCFLRVPVGGTSIIPFCMHGSFSKILSAYAVQITVVSLDPEKPAGSPPALRRR